MSERSFAPFVGAITVRHLADSSSCLVLASASNGELHFSELFGHVDKAAALRFLHSDDSADGAEEPVAVAGAREAPLGLAHVLPAEEASHEGRQPLVQPCQLLVR